jgi:ribosome-associated toxin RatA of RatAB toxin-antitoxin module
MAHIHRHALLMFSDQQMFDLVNDVGAYPLYLDGCVATSVLEQSAEHMLAELRLEKKGIKLNFTTRNQLDGPKSIVMQLEDGPFDSFEGRWFFQHLDVGACKIILDIQFSLSNRLQGMAAKKLFDAVANSMVDAMVKRANLIYDE